MLRIVRVYEYTSRVSWLVARVIQSSKSEIRKSRRTNGFMELVKIRKDTDTCLFFFSISVSRFFFFSLITTLTLFLPVRYYLPVPGAWHVVTVRLIDSTKEREKIERGRRGRGGWGGGGWQSLHTYEVYICQSTLKVDQRRRGATSIYLLTSS